MLRALSTPRHSPRELSIAAATDDRAAAAADSLPLDLLHSHWAHFAPDIVNRDEDVRQRAAAELRRAVERDLQSLAPEDSTRLVDELTTRVFDLVNSAETVEKLAGLSMLQQLLLLLQQHHSSHGSLALPLQQHETVIARCTQLFRILFQQLTGVTESRVLELAAATLGQLCRSAPTLTADTVHFHCRQALDWLSSAAERSDRRHLAAAYVLRELSAQTPSLFAAYAQQLMDCCWLGLRDARAETREVTVAVIANLLSDLSKRSPLTFANICEQLYEEARNVLQQHSHALSANAASTSASPSSLSVPSSPLVSGRQLPRSPQAKASPPSASKRAPPASLPAVHSALLLLHQLVQHSRPLMLLQLPRVFELVAKHRDSRDVSIVRAELQLLPTLAALRPDAFLSSQADWVLEFVLSRATGSGGQQADAAMAALSQLMAIAGEGLAVYVDGIVAAVDAVLAAGVAGSAGAGSGSGSAGLLGGKRKDRERDADRVRRVKRMTEAALDAIGVMSRHLPLSFFPFADHLLDCMLRCPLSPSLISALTAIMQHLPQLSADIQLRLADTLILVLSAPFMQEQAGNGDGQTAAAAASAAAAHGHGHSHSISSFSALSSFSSSTPVAAFFPLISPAVQLPSAPSVPAATTLPVVAAGIEATKPMSPFSLPRHLQLHRLQPAPSTAIDSSLVLLAFSTLSTFPFSFSTQFSLLALARFTLTRYMEEDGLLLRREAALTTLHLIAKIAEAIATTFSSTSTSSSSSAASSAVLGSQLSLVCYDVVRRIVVLAVTDSSLSIRSALLSSLHSETRLDRFLVQPDLLSCIFLCLHDEYSDIRHAAILLLGRLAQKNPAHILPTLRITLLQLLNELQDDAVGVGGESSVRGGGEGRRGLSQEEGARMLGELIGSCHALIRPYVDSILGVLVPKLGGAEQVLREGGAGGAEAVMIARRRRNETLVASVLSTLGKLSVICGDGMAEFLDHLLPLLLDSLYPPHISAAVHAAAATAGGTHNPGAAAALLPAPFAASASAPPFVALSIGSSSDRRQMTLRTLHLLLSSTSSVVGPFIKYPHFLPCLLHLIKTDRSRAVRLEATRLIGLVGAIDPFVYRRCQQDWQTVMGERDGGAGAGGSSLGAGGDGKTMRRAASEPSKSLAGAAATGSVKADKAPAAKEKAEAAKEETKREDGDDGNAMAGGGSLSDGVARVAQQRGELMAADDDDGDGNDELYLCQTQAYDEYFPSVSLASLMRVVVDPQLLSFHTLALHALMFVLKTLGKEKCSPFLPAIVPAFLREIRAASDEALRVSYIRQLAAIVQLVGAGVKTWVDEMIEVSLAHWPLPAVVTGPSAPIAPLFTIPTLSTVASFSAAAPPALLQPVLQLFEQLSIHVPSQFQSHFPFVLSRFLSLFADVPSEQNVASARAVLTSLAVFAAHCNFTAQLHLLLPSLLDLCEEQNDRAQPRSLLLRIDAVHAIAVISFHHDCSAQASRILQPFARILAAAPTAAQAAPSPSALSSASSLAPSGSSNGAASSPQSASSSPLLRPTQAAASVQSLLFRETLGAVCSLITQMSFAFLLFEPLITRAIREREKAAADRTAHAVAVNGAATLTAPVDGKGGGSMGKAGTPGRDGEKDRERDASWRDREAEQVSRYFCMVERLKGRLNEVRERVKHEREGRGCRTDDEEEWDREREREREGEKAREKEREKERERRSKERRNTMSRMTAGSERERERARCKELTASASSERDKERHKETGRDSLSSFHLIAAASALPLDSLDGVKAVAPSTFLSPNSSPAAAPSPPPEVADGMPSLLLPMNQSNLARFFSSSHQSTSDDWLTWLRALQLALLRESPSFALRACSALASNYPPLARELLCDAFVSCWREMDDAVRDQVIDSLDSLLTACIQPLSSVPADVVLCVLNVADHCQHHDQPLPLSHRRLGAAAERCSAHARALYHHECLFRYEPSPACIESLIAVNTKLQLSAAAAGVLQFAMRHEAADGIKPMWFEKLHRWDEALSAYERRQLVTAQQQQPDSRSHELLLGRLRCLKELQQWERLAALASTAFLSTDDSAVRSLIAPLVSAAVHQLRCWELLEPYLPYLAPGSFDGCFYRALYSLHAADASPAQQQQIIDRAGEAVEAQLTGLSVDSYGRAYGSIVRLQQCAEMSEVIAYKSGSDERKAAIRRLWAARLQGAQRSVGVWSEILGVRALVMSPKDDVALWLDYAKLARKSGKLTLSLKILTALMGFDPTLLVTAKPPAALPAAQPQLTFASLKHLYAVGYHRTAYSRLCELVNSDALQVEEGGQSSGGLSKQDVDRFKARCYLKLGGWQLELMDGLTAAAFLPSAADAAQAQQPPLLPASSLGSPGSLTSPVAPSAWRREEELNASRHAAYNAILPQVLNFFHAATVYDPASAKAWHQLSMSHFMAVQRNKRGAAQQQQQQQHAAVSHRGSLDASKRGSIVSLAGAAGGVGSGGRVAGTAAAAASAVDIHHHIVPAISGFFRSILLHRWSESSRQDVLRVLQLWFEYGWRKEVEAAMISGINSISIDTWLAVIPQMIARLHTPHPSIRFLLHELLSKIGRSHPQALVYPLTVASKSQSDTRRASSLHVLSTIRQHSALLVSQASTVSSELVRVAILWHELWHEAIEEASRLWFGQHNAEACIATLQPLHEMMAKGASTANEQHFLQQFGAELNAAAAYCLRFTQTQSVHFLTRAWELYSSVFRQISKSMASQQSLQLAEVSPKLLSASDLQLAVPGSYRSGAPVVRIGFFSPVLRVIESKQHPRRLSISGSDGREYRFLLKGHEDLRQDERVMQLFGLVNTFLSLDRSTAKLELQISRYAVVPLSPNSGLIEWVPSADTLHALIRQYRDAKRIELNIEQRLMLRMAPDYQLLPGLHKVEVFQHALLNTSEYDLARTLHVRARSAELWLEHRQRFTRSLAVMSIVGYVLGLGDRHPCNLMLERASGSIVHIDFGDCFEVAMNRDKYPERVPFRLTRMLVAAMDSGGSIDGSFIATCRLSMAMMRKNRNSVMALLEAFVYDPLINWRLLTDHKQQPAADSADGTQPTSPTSPLSPQQQLQQQQQAAPPAPPAAPAAGGRRPSTVSSRRPSALSGLPSSAGSVEVGTNPLTRDRRRSIIAVAEESQRERRLDEGRGAEEDEELNEKAVTVIARIGRKLKGTDFDDAEDSAAAAAAAAGKEGQRREREATAGGSRVEESEGGGQQSLDVHSQVERLIREATEHRNLCQAYIGWCPFW